MDSEQNRNVPEEASCAQAEPAQKRQSDLKRAFAEDGALKTHVGGQALIEGVMMRGKFNWAAAVREPSGNIYVEEHDLASGKKKNGWLYWPIVRGCRAFVESLVLGYKALEDRGSACVRGSIFRRLAGRWRRRRRLHRGGPLWRSASSRFRELA